MNQVKPSEQVVGRVTTVSLSQLVARRLRATLVRGLTQTRFLLVLSDCDWLFFTSDVSSTGGSEVKLCLSLY